MIRLIWNLSVRTRLFLRTWMPTNVLLDAIRTRRGLRWGIPAMLFAIPYLLIANLCVQALADGGPGWLHLVVLWSIWSSLKMLWIGPVSVILLICARLHERAARRARRRTSIRASVSLTCTNVSKARRGRVDRRRRRLDDFPPGRTAWCPAVDRGRERARRTGLDGIPIEHREPGPVDVGRVGSARRRHRVRLRHSKGRHAHRQASGQRFRDSRPNSGLRRMGLSPQPSDNRAALDSRNRSCGIKQLAADIAVIRSYAPPAT